MNTPYMPSNGSELDAFMSRCCYHCKHDNTMTGDGDVQCSILDEAMTSDVPQWVQRDGVPTCTSFLRREHGDDYVQLPIVNQQQLNLFEEDSNNEHTTS